MLAVSSSVPSSDNNNNVRSGDLSDNETLKTSGKYVRLILFSLLITIVVSCHHQLLSLCFFSFFSYCFSLSSQKKQKCVFHPQLPVSLAKSICLQCSKRVHKVD